MDKKLNVSSSPHLRTPQNTSFLMRSVVIALLPAAIMGIINFGWRALLIMLVSIASCILFETFMNKLLKRVKSAFL